MTWIAPWRRGLPQAECSTCTDAFTGRPKRVVAMTLTNGRCAHCVAHPPRQQTPPESEPLPALFEMPSGG